VTHNERRLAEQKKLLDAYNLYRAHYITHKDRNEPMPSIEEIASKFDCPPDYLRGVMLFEMGFLEK